MTLGIKTHAKPLQRNFYKNTNSSLASHNPCNRVNNTNQSFVKFLGHVISSSVVTTDSVKIQAIQNDGTKKCEGTPTFCGHGDKLD